MSDSTYRLIMKAVGFDKADQKTKKLSGSLGKLAKKAGAVAGAYFGSQAIISGLKKASEAYARQEQAIRKLNTALGGNTKGLQAYASQLQAVTRFGDEATLEQMAFLGSIGMTEQQIKDIIPVAMDLATATGMSLESAVRNTAKTFSGMAGELGELVPQIRGLTAEQMRAGDAVVVMGELFGGQAQADAESYAGKIEQMSNSLGDMFEVVGGKLAPVVTELAGYFTDLFTPYFSDTLIAEKDRFEDLTDVLLDSNSSLSSRKLAIDELNTNYGDYIGNLNLEEAGYDDLYQMQQKSLGVMKQKIALQTFDEEIVALTKERVKAERELLDAELNKDDIQMGKFQDIETGKIRLKQAQKEVDAIDAKIQKLEDEMVAYADMFNVVLPNQDDIIDNNSTQSDQINELKDKINELKEEIIELNEEEENNASISTDNIEAKIDLYDKMKKTMKDYYNAENIGRKEASKNELEATALQAQSAKAGALGVIQAEIAKATARLVSSIFAGVGYPFNLILAGTAGGVVNALMSDIVAKNLAEGYDGVVTSPTLFRAGEQGAERIQVTNLTKEGGGIDSPSGSGSIVINAEVATEEFMDRVIDYMDNKQSMNLA